MELFPLFLSLLRAKHTTQSHSFRRESSFLGILCLAHIIHVVFEFESLQRVEFISTFPFLPPLHPIRIVPHTSQHYFCWYSSRRSDETCKRGKSLLKISRKFRVEGEIVSKRRKEMKTSQKISIHYSPAGVECWNLCRRIVWEIAAPWALKLNRRHHDEGGGRREERVSFRSTRGQRHERTENFISIISQFNFRLPEHDKQHRSSSRYYITAIRYVEWPICSLSTLSSIEIWNHCYRALTPYFISHAIPFSGVFE